MNNGSEFAQGLVDGLDIGSLLSVQIDPLWGYAFVLAGLALCLAGYFLYRLMVALAASIAGGAVTYLLAPSFGVEGPGLWTTAIGVAIVLFVVGWFLYGVVVFLTGAAGGFVVGTILWLVGSGRLTDLSELSGITVRSAEMPALIATVIPAAIALGLVALQWERRMITLLAVVLGAMVVTLGLRYIQPPEVIAPWVPLIASAALLAGLFLTSRARISSDPSFASSWPIRRPAARAQPRQQPGSSPGPRRPLAAGPRRTPRAAARK
ncbi:MAG: DUF4203 domain-containing protein [Chloroflexi bacterium]|nr:DUF4203 domain-containing protein [Chloroflexota bacterium]